MNKSNLSFTSILSLFTVFCLNSLLFPQTNSYSSTEIYQRLNKLKVLGSVLYIAAHPDDENTALLTYMSKGKLTRTAYLSLTRGDGGQNLLGNEKGDLLGVIRTQELLSARKIDGAEQFFTRAIDFGYSKTAKETLRNWDRELLLGDVVKVIRKFRPDVILTRFSKTQGGHGQHLTSAILAEEAFYAAADPSMYTNQLETLEPWQAKRLYWNTWQPSDKAVSIDIGEYNPIIGKSFNEIAADARSMHKSQGFGVSPNRGTQLVHFDYFAGDSANNDLFDGIDLSWGRVEGGKAIEDEIHKIISLYNSDTPETILPYLVKLYNNMGGLNDKYWVEKKQQEVKELIKISTGLWMESIIWEPEISLGQNMDVRPMIINRSNYPIILEDISATFSNTDLDVSQKLEYNKPITVKQNVTIPADHNYSQPYWLKTKHDGKLFTVQDNDLIGDPENKPDIISTFALNIDGTSFSYEIPVIYRWVDAVKGELTKPLVIRPDLSISVEQENLVFANGSTKELKVNIISKIDSALGKITIDLPEGWTSEVDGYNFSLNEKGDRTTFSFKVSPTNSAKSGSAKFRAILNGKTFTDEIVEIDYPHIQYQTVLKPVNVDLIKLEIEIENKRIGYIMGSGDDIPLSLRELGYDIELLSDEDLD
ncbi:MAG: PIG-L family deacetylase, partial [Melioribacteraceae bacterium]|nr:PIG-L family deacetylase [Melioribacteraceae bacterium]